MSPAEESAYIKGRDAALRMTLMHAARELSIFADGDDPLVALARLADERARVEAQLRELCEQLDIDFPEGLDLADVVEKHIARAVAELDE